MIGAYSDMGLKPLLAQRGISDAQARVCLADPVALKKIIALSQEGSSKYQIDHTPSFLINGKYTDVHDVTAIVSQFTN